MSRTPITSFSASKLSLKVKRRTPKKRTYKSENSRAISVKRAVKHIPMNVNPSSVSNDVTVNVKNHISAVRLRKNEIRARIEQILLKSCPNFLSPSLPHNVSLRSIRRKAKEIAATLGVGSFVPSRRWILSFVHRHKLLNNATVANNKCVNIGTSDGVNGTSETLPKVHVNSVYELSDSDTSLEEVSDDASSKKPPSLKSLFARVPEKELQNNNDNITPAPFNIQQPFSYPSTLGKSHPNDNELPPIQNLFCTPPRSSSEDCTNTSSNQITNPPKNGLSVSSVKVLPNLSFLPPLSDLFVKPPSSLSNHSKLTKRNGVSDKLKKKISSVVPCASTSVNNSPSCFLRKEISPFPKSRNVLPLQSLFLPTQSATNEIKNSNNTQSLSPTHFATENIESSIDFHLKDVRNWQEKLYRNHKPKNLKRTLYSREMYRIKNLIPIQKLSKYQTGFCLVLTEGKDIPDVLKYGRSKEQICNDLFDAIQEIESEPSPQEILMDTETPQPDYCYPNVKEGLSMHHNNTTLNESQTFIDEITSNFTFENVNLIINDLDLDWLDS